MSNPSGMPISNKQSRRVINYYRYHAHIYDATRWSFLFGRKTLINKIPSLPSNPKILEIGCGTGQNLIQLHKRFPTAKITGVDLSADMLTKARKNITNSSITLKNERYPSGNVSNHQFDLILLSYSLTMMDADYQCINTKLKNNLNPQGYLAVVDFNTSPFAWFRKWMNINHVDFSGSLFSLLDKNFNSIKTHFYSAYFGLWDYFLFIGTKNRS